MSWSQVHPRQGTWVEPSPGILIASQEGAPVGKVFNALEASMGSAGSLAFGQAQPSPHVLIAQVVEFLRECRGVQLGPD
jgi:hypothetical protein